MIGQQHLFTGRVTFIQKATLSVMEQMLQDLLRFEVATGFDGGLVCNEAWIQTMSGTDIDSQVGNKVEAEDDFARACVSVPIRLCRERNEKVELTAPTGGTSYQWYKDGSPISGATSNKYMANSAGEYTVIVDNTPCASNICCPIYVEEFCDCPPKVCLPVTIQRTKTGPR